MSCADIRTLQGRVETTQTVETQGPSLGKLLHLHSVWNCSLHDRCLKWFGCMGMIGTGYWAFLLLQG